MKIVFRTDASIQIGTGHVMRCLTLANALRLKGAECTFICRAHTGHLLDLIHQCGHDAIALAINDAQHSDSPKTTPIHAAWLGSDWTTDASDTQKAIAPQAVDWLVVDHYALDERWEKSMRTYCRRLMVIDDLADRPHDCDLLLDQNLGRTAEDYEQLISPIATALIGTRYALLRPEFFALRQESLARRLKPQLKHLLITMGGVDKDNATDEVLNALRHCTLPQTLRITVVMGQHAPWLTHVQATAQTMPWPTEVRVNVDDMARLMTDSDLVIGAAGGTAWERCSLGLPSLVTALAENQRAGAEALKNRGAALTFQNSHELAVLIENPLISAEQPRLLQELSAAAAAITTGNGVSLVLQNLEHLDA
jgi:UDP-2,4-diacetamido-2,4,6-trideoxy-beta-L-altropyranose hydrolase